MGRVIDDFALGSFIDKRVSTYSGGQRRRLDLAATFVVRPALLLLDEPTTGLDSQSRLDLWQSIRALPGSGTSVLLTTQHLEEAQALADEVVIIDEGRIVRMDTPDQLRREMSTRKLTVATLEQMSSETVHLVAADLQAEVMHHEGSRFSLSGEILLDAVLGALKAQGIDERAIVEFSLAPPELEEVFLTLTRPKAVQ
ncbi:ABC transporter, ATP-binding protein [Leucobacter sp. 7(1)]|nr:ABC transporter, ATP-binding protein [Leucobacter sp. 7(1)]